MATLRLPLHDGTLAPYTLRTATPWPVPAVKPTFNRVAYSAAHVVADPLARVDPFVDAALDWDATLAYRRHLFALGLGVAEAMDTAQRGMGLDWATSLALIERSVDAASDIPGALIACGAGTDHLDAAQARTIDDVIAAYEHQCAAVERAGGRVILMASRALARVAQSADDYVRVYGTILAQIREPVILHWLGDMFDPALAGYWGHRDLDRATDVCLDVIRGNAGKIDGIKVSLLDDAREIALRGRLPPGVRMYTGDDFNFAALIGGDESGHSDALLGIFDAIAPAASAALAALATGDRARFDAILAATVPLSRRIFEAPTRFYKTGIVLMAWLNGHQAHFTMVGGQQGARSLVHLADVFRLADAAGLLADPDRAAARMRVLTALHGL
ncbi:MAG TPA: dihydrodipicolinate synthase family protein [Casimicrobiaceae bacterium]|nr:dihydrodipicolinate synthase family protein [Casimicrobiaceae bacterium]